MAREQKWIKCSLSLVPLCDRHASLLTPFPTLNLVVLKLQNYKTRLHFGRARNSEQWLESIFIRTSVAAKRKASSVLMLVDRNKTGSLLKCWCFIFPPPQSMRLGGSSSSWMMEVPVVVGGGQGYLLGVDLGCQLLNAWDRKWRCLEMEESLRHSWSNDLGGD